MREDQRSSLILYLYFGRESRFPQALFTKIIYRKDIADKCKPGTRGKVRHGRI